MKHIREAFTEEEFETLKKTKGKMTWHNFILMLSWEKCQTLAKEIKEEMTNGWSDQERSHFRKFLEEEIKPYWPQLYTFLSDNLSEEAEK
jgi:hypothetical protein